MNKLKKILLFLFLLALAPNFLYAQTLKAWVTAGDKSADESKYAEAIEYYNKALEFETDDPNLYFKVAEACRLYKDYERAAAWYGKIVINDRNNRFPLALFRYAEMKKYLGMYEEAGRMFERYVANNPNDTTYFGIKSRKESADCKIAPAIADKKSNATFTNAGTPVNSVYSDFGASKLGDTVLYFSSLKFLYEPDSHKEDSYYVSRILMANTSNNKSSNPIPLSIIFNDAPTHNCNVTFSPDYKIMVFTRCTSSEDFSLDCELYLSKWEDGKWAKPFKLGTEVNMEGYTATQPAIEARGADGYSLYFVSDRPGGKGKLDIWKSQFNAALKFETPVNLGDTINTFDDEMTPFFDTPEQTLYFSSYGHTGIGGMDIFKSVILNGKFSTPENMGAGYNTSVNDVYYTKSRDGKSGTLSSNRVGSMFIKSKTCCYDIYYYNINPPDSTTSVKKDTSTVSIAPVKTSATPKNEVTVLATRSTYDEFLPLQLYFDNDEPDKRTMGITTRKDYETLYRNYIARTVDYKNNFAGPLQGAAKTDAEKNVDNFFTNQVTASWNLLNQFCDKVEKALKKGIKIELEIRGRTSPLAETSYNENLSKRRISSFVNYLKQYHSGALQSYFENGSLVVTEVASGESLVDQNVSDKLNDKRNSVYNPNAAIERRIELINIKLVEP